jgi:type VI protein secretion system component VasK
MRRHRVFAGTIKLRGFMFLLGKWIPTEVVNTYALLWGLTVVPMLAYIFWGMWKARRQGRLPPPEKRKRKKRTRH